MAKDHLVFGPFDGGIEQEIVRACSAGLPVRSAIGSQSAAARLMPDTMTVTW